MPTSATVRVAGIAAIAYNADCEIAAREVEMWEEIEAAFDELLSLEGRRGVMAAVPLAEVRLLPEQTAYLRRKLAPLGLPGDGVTALSLGIGYHPEEIEPIPGGWTAGREHRPRWNEYARAYHGLNGCLRRVAVAIAERFGGVVEGPTRDGIVGQVSHVRDYFPTCVSHRSVAEAAGLGWRGRHGLIVTPEFGSALRLSTAFLPLSLPAAESTPSGAASSRPTRHSSLITHDSSLLTTGCGDCRACLDVCPILRRWGADPDQNLYREGCRRRIKALGLDADVCGICVRRCWEVVRSRG